MSTKEASEETKMAIKVAIMAYVSANPAITEDGLKDRLFEDKVLRKTLQNIPMSEILDWISRAAGGQDVRQEAPWTTEPEPVTVDEPIPEETTPPPTPSTNRKSSKLSRARGVVLRQVCTEVFKREPMLSNPVLLQIIKQDSRVQEFAKQIGKSTVVGYIALIRKGTDITKMGYYKEKHHLPIEEGPHSCECGRTFATVASRAGHMSHCEEHMRARAEAVNYVLPEPNVTSTEPPAETPTADSPDGPVADTPKQLTARSEEIMDALRALIHQNEEYSEHAKIQSATIKTHEATISRLNKSVSTLQEELLKWKNRDSGSELTLNTS